MLAVKVEDVATPLPLAAAVQEYVWELDVHPLLAKVSLAPDAGPVNVTEALGTRLPKESFTVATRGAAKPVLTVAD